MYIDFMDRRSALKQTALVSGIVLSPGIITTLLNSCSPTYENAWIPSFFNHEVMEDIRQMAEDIIPRTDTPGALDVGVDKFIDVAVKNCLDSDAQSKMNLLFSDVRELNRNAFHSLKEIDRHEVISNLENSSSDSISGSSYRTFKYLVLLGYFTSEEGLKSNLNYKPVPGKYEGCITISKDEKILIGGRV